MGRRSSRTRAADRHTLAAADATGTVGPDLDQVRPDVARVVEQVTNGAMPAFDSKLSDSAIQDLAEFVSDATRTGTTVAPGGVPSRR